MNKMNNTSRQQRNHIFTFENQSDFRSKNIPGQGRYETYFDTRQIIGEKNKYSIPKAPRQVSSNKSRAFLH